MKHLTYREWQDQVIADINEGEFSGQVTCDICGGDGVVSEPHDCNCIYCDQDDERDCDDCEGSGRYKPEPGDVGESNRDSALPWSAYTAVLEADLRKLAAWQCRPVERVLADAGFTVHSDIRTREVIAEMDRAAATFRDQRAAA